LNAPSLPFNYNLTQVGNDQWPTKVFYDMSFIQIVGRHFISSIRLMFFQILAELRGRGAQLGAQLCVLNVKLFCIESSLRYERDVTTRHIMVTICSDTTAVTPFGGGLVK
jgi:hypothetical protein